MTESVTYVAVGPNVWGKGATVKEAKAKMRSVGGTPTEWYVKKVWGFLYVDGIDGSIHYNDRRQPVLIARKKHGKRAEKMFDDE